MNIRARTTALFMLSIALTTSAAHAGGVSQPNSSGSSPSSQAISASAATTATNSVTSIVAAALPAIPAGGGSTTVQINGTTATVTTDAAGGVLINGQPIVVDGLPNLGLLIALGYGG